MKTPQAQAEQLIAQHLAAMLVLGGFSYSDRIEFAKRSASITALTAKINNADNTSYWEEVTNHIEKYTIQ
jgi:phosphoribosylformylglycinamidine (FGAM) synthase-like amidotransferase family enzyme